MPIEHRALTRLMEVATCWTGGEHGVFDVDEGFHGATSLVGMRPPANRVHFACRLRTTATGYTKLS